MAAAIHQHYLSLLSSNNHVALAPIRNYIMALLKIFLLGKLRLDFSFFFYYWYY